MNKTKTEGGRVVEEPNLDQIQSVVDNNRCSQTVGGRTDIISHNANFINCIENVEKSIRLPMLASG